MKFINQFFVVLNKNIKSNIPFFKIRKTKFLLQLIKLLIKYKFLIGVTFDRRCKLLIVFIKLDYKKIYGLTTLVNCIVLSSKRIYIKVSQVKIQDSLFVLSTPKGVLTQVEAQSLGVGGKLLFKIF